MGDWLDLNSREHNALDGAPAATTPPPIAPPLAPPPAQQQQPQQPQRHRLRSRSCVA